MRLNYRLNRQRLIDINGNEIPDTECNVLELYYEDDRYIPATLIPDEVDDQMLMTGATEGITTDIYDTKLGEYVVKGIPMDTLDIRFYYGEPEPIIEASKMIGEYEQLEIRNNRLLNTGQCAKMKTVIFGHCLG